jgi:hypothetical protein
MANGGRIFIRNSSKKKKEKNIPVTGSGGLQGCEMLRISHCLDNQLIDGGKIVSPTHPPISLHGATDHKIKLL